MSTKSTIASGEDFHFYSEMFDDENVYLHLYPGADFVATPDSLTVTIPLAILETIRRTKPMDFSLVGLSDDELLARAAAEADERHRDHEEFCARNPGWESDPQSRLFVPSPREELIPIFLDRYKEERECQQTVLARMKTYQISNGATFAYNFNDGTTEVIAGSVTDGTGEKEQK